jgi:hypothetical protein
METCIGVITHYFSRLGVAVLSLTGDLKANAIIHIQGHTTDFYQAAWSMEIDHQKIEIGKAGQEIALKVPGSVRRGDKVYLAPGATPTRPEDIQQPWLDPWER